MLALLLAALALQAEPDPPIWAIEHVAVIPMRAGDERLPEAERVLADQTVLVQGERILAVGPAARTAVPKGARRIAGTGRYLIPGLVDMHAHLLSDERIDESYAETELELLLAKGVTTVRIPIGRPGHLALRERVAKGELLGPTLFVASPQLCGRAFGRRFHGSVVTTAEEARAAVGAAQEAGYDFVKLTFWITPEVFDATVASARAAGLPVIGHVDPSVGLEHALASGMQIEHLDQYLEALLPPDVPASAGVSGTNVWRRESWPNVARMDAEKIGALAARVAASGTASTPTQFFLNSSFGTGRTDEELRASPEWRMVSDAVRDELLEGRARFWADPPPAELRERFVALRDAIVVALHEAGAPLLAGSDAPEWLLVPGFALHRELGALVQAGLEPWDALAAATRAPCVWLGIADERGSIEPGRRADLVLLADDPLADIANAAAIDGVFAGGRWLEQARLAGLFYGAAGRLSQAPLSPPETR